jgi:hypothetical protein
MTGAEVARKAIREYQQWVDANGPDVTGDDREQCRRFRQALATLRECATPPPRAKLGSKVPPNDPYGFLTPSGGQG